MSEHFPPSGADRDSPFLPLSRGPQQRKVGFGTLTLVCVILPVCVLFWWIGNRGIDAGFYMPADFLQAQRDMMMHFVTMLIIPPALLVCVIARAVWRERQRRIVRSFLIVFLLLFSTWLYNGAASFNASGIMPELSRQDVTALADRPIPQLERSIRVTDYTYEATTFTVHVTLDHAVSDDDVDRAIVGPGMCRRFGVLFGGPVDEIVLQAVGPDGAPRSVGVSQQQCRDWYLLNRIPPNRPNRRLAFPTDRLTPMDVTPERET